LREVAAAFMAVGQGASYTMAADRARGAAGRRQAKLEQGGQMVAEWLDSLAPIVIAASTETKWPPTLILDSTRFMDPNPNLSSPVLAFNVLAAYGYPLKRWLGKIRGRVWLLRASHSAGIVEWEDFLRNMDIATPPEVVIVDGDQHISRAIRRVWPAQPSPSMPLPFIFRCEYHLSQNALEKIALDLYPTLKPAPRKKMLAKHPNVVTQKPQVAFCDTAG
jgi:hypothetical protein